MKQTDTRIFECGDDEISLFLTDKDDHEILEADAIKRHKLEKENEKLKEDLDHLKIMYSNKQYECKAQKITISNLKRDLEDALKSGWSPTIENADETPKSRADILDQAKKCVCGQREQDYGTPESNFQLIADLWNDYLGITDYVLELQERIMDLKDKGVDVNVNIPDPSPILSVDVAMMMALLKIARIRNGGGSGDSFVDLAGYAACGGEIFNDRRRE